MLLIVFLFCTPFLSPVRPGNPSDDIAVAQPATGTVHAVKYLDLPIWQLKLIGIDCSTKGVFYKNQNPDWKKENNRYQLLCFYLTDETYCSNLNYHDGEKIKAGNKAEKILEAMPVTTNAFNPVMITNLNGDRTWDAFSVYNDPGMKLLPVRINMEDLQMNKRKDMMVFWFKPTEALKKALAEYVDIDPFLTAP